MRRFSVGGDLTVPTTPPTFIASTLTQFPGSQLARQRARELGIELGSMETGNLNAITDVEGVGVGHSTLIEGDSIRTGVTAIAPHGSNLIDEKVVAAVDLFNAYGKSTSLPQIIYEGVLETPIVLTETMN